MYSTCLFCKKTLEANETFDTFPVGKRLAFDAVKGRLWVVCKHCERWNLSPLEERWETIEQAERIYRDTKARVTTDNVGLARLKDGTELVRIGQPQRPEFAAWRYGDQFGRRRQRNLLIAGAGAAAIGGIVIGGAVVGVSVGGFAGSLGPLVRTLVHGRPDAVVAHVPTAERGLVVVRRRHLAETSLDRDVGGSLMMNLRLKQAHDLDQAVVTLRGRDAERAASVLVPLVNRFGGNRRTVDGAVTRIEASGGPERYLEDVAGLARSRTKVAFSVRGRRTKRWKSTDAKFGKTGLYGLPTEYRLALEMALHEDAERRAMEGELAELEASWREAEEIAAISDSLLVAPDVDAEFKRLRGNS